MKRIIITFFLLMTISCGNLFDKKKLNLKIIENEEIKIEVYDISNITSIHQFADITNKRWNKSERIFEGNSNTIEKIKIKNDTIYIMTKQLEPIIYDLAAIKFSYKVVIETNKLK